MTDRIQNIRRKAASAVAALALSTIFVGAAVGHAVVAPAVDAQVQQTA